MEAILTNFTSIILLVGFMGFAFKRLLVYLHAFQQEEYDGNRFMAWLFRHKLFDRKLTLILLLLGFAWFFAGGLYIFVDFAVLAAFGFIAYTEPDPRTHSKKKLAMTERAKRIMLVAMSLVTVLGCIVFLIHMPWIWIIPVQLVPILLVGANAILQPYENAVQKKLLSEAHNKIKQLNTTIIGVTGSFGKTSVKHILGHVLQTVAPTLVTPGSVNTPMGITRIIREELNETHKYFIVEMGAYGPGSIERLCKLAPPNFGIITAIGHAHYERFKSLDTVAQTKFELAQNVLQNGGKTIVHENTLKFPYSSEFERNHGESLIVCGDDETNALTIENIRQTLHGLEVRVRFQDKVHVIEAPLFGAHHGENLALAFAAAVSLGIEPAIVINALKSTPQIPHRLQVKPYSKDSGIIIDDAFNSNPRGFNSALALLRDIGKHKRKILITPGMVELGAAHDEIHKQIGTHAAQSCDIAIIVQSSRIPTFIRAFLEEARSDQQLMEVETFAEAQKWINDNIQKDDMILIENDLPDVYERLPKF